MSTRDDTRPMAPVAASDPATPDPSASRRRFLTIAAAAAGLALLVEVFFIGRSTGSSSQSGPTSLGAALTAARTGSLPCGTRSTLSRRALDRLCSGNLAAPGGGAVAVLAAGVAPRGRGPGGR